MSTQTTYREINWRSEVEHADPRPQEEVIYEFSNGRKFTENFNPTNGPYEPSE